MVRPAFAAAVLAGPLVLVPAGALSQTLQASALKLHNRERALVGVPALTWDAALADQASAWARELARRDRMQHSPIRSRPGQGENLAMGTRGAFTPDALMLGWSNEKRLYRHGVFPEVSTTGRWGDVGHYTQMVWRNTRALGCGVASSRRWDYVVCRYAPPGNYRGRSAY